MLGVDDIKVTIATLGIGDNTIENFTHFIDANNNLVLKADKPMSKMSIYNLLGQQVVSENLSNAKETFSLSGLNVGTYIVKVLIDNQEKSFQIIKK